ncbi:MAG TPA: hypothetical protein VFA59_22575 [Vicinamibacterales bacterium]|nr:hypothetical protein [Vicinamibacterales bacterium]
MAEAHVPHAHHNDPTHNVGVAHEESDVNIRGIFGFAVGLTIATMFICFVVWVLFSFYASRENATVTPAYPLAAQQRNRLPPEPRLQTNPRQDLSDLRAQEDQVLRSYGWVDKSTGVVRIPIEQAMKAIVQKGLPARQQSK